MRVLSLLLLAVSAYAQPPSVGGGLPIYRSGGSPDLSAYLPLAGGTMTGPLVEAANGAASTPPLSLTGTWFTGGSATTTKPQLLVEPSGTTSTAWSTAGTGLGVNAPSGFTGTLLDLQLNGVSKLKFSDHLQLSSYVEYFNTAGTTSFGYFYPLSDGNFVIANSAGNAGKLTFIGTDAAYPMLKRVATAVAFRLGDDSADAPITASNATFSGADVILSGLGSATGTPDSVCLNTNTLKRNAALTCTVSSRDFKTGIEALPTLNASALLMQLQPVQFAYNDRTERMRWGFISEQVAGVDRRFGDGWDVTGVPRSLDQNAILALTVKTVQEQQVQIEQLTNQLRRLPQ